ncbi:cold-shock protein [Candidatus Woesearchaeota archaeon]|nr:cold-shock protein [Candidatus Woesearchaeota archaeon]
MEGTVKFFNRIKGFGFINGDDGKDYFVHVSEVGEGKYLNEGDRVTFDGVEDEKGLKAKNIQLAGEGSEAPAEEAPEEEAPVEEEAPAEEATEEETPAEEEAPAEESTEEETPAEEEKEE